MACITTTAEQNAAARVAHTVGGYSHLIRLAAEHAELERLGKTPKLIRVGGVRYAFVEDPDTVGVSSLTSPD